MQAGGSHTTEARVVRIFDPLAGSRELRRAGASVPTFRVTHFVLTEADHSSELRESQPARPVEVGLREHLPRLLQRAEL